MTIRESPPTAATVNGQSGNGGFAGRYFHLHLTTDRPPGQAERGERP